MAVQPELALDDPTESVDALWETYTGAASETVLQDLLALQAEQSNETADASMDNARSPEVDKAYSNADSLEGEASFGSASGPELSPNEPDSGDEPSPRTESRQRLKRAATSRTPTIFSRAHDEEDKEGLAGPSDSKRARSQFRPIIPASLRSNQSSSGSP